ncbi:MAG: hypothetical protein LBT30_01875 [Clostridiales bacterium]|jgi:hypothetical protein|nr:hypothetical protein [Clostridiales bacterium]
MKASASKVILSEYDSKIHRYGRISVLVCDALFIAAPIAIAIYLGAKPEWNAFFAAFAVVAVIYWSSAIAEFALYAPLLGPGATYLAFVTGNISNIKLPCAVNAQDITGVKQGTKESEIISTIAVAVSAITTTLIMSAGVLFLALFSKPLEDFFRHPNVEPVFQCILPSLFGALCYSYIVKKPKLGIFPLAFALIIFIVAPGFANTDTVATMIIVIGIVSVVSALIMYKKGWLKPRANKIKL